MKKMGFRIMRKVKTLFLTFGVVSLGMYVLLNSLASEFSLKDATLSEIGNNKIQLSELKNNEYQELALENNKVQTSFAQRPLRNNEVHNAFSAQGQRKRKTLLNNEYNPVDNYYEYNEETDDKKLNSYKNRNPDSEGGSDVLKFEHSTDNLNEIHAKSDRDNISNKEGFDEEVDSNDDYDEDDDDNYDPNDEDEAYVYDNDKNNININDADKDIDNDAVTNAPFKAGDFGDYSVETYYKKPKLKFAEVKDAVHGVYRNNDEISSNTDGNNDKQMKELIENGIYWSEYVESLIPKGKSYTEVTKEIAELRKHVVKTLDSPTWDRCGRPLNAYAVLSDQTQLCVRYRQPHTSFIYGEALSFYLSRLLRMDNVPSVILAKTNSTSRLWRDVNISSLTWEENKLVAFISWIDEINSGVSSRAYIPPLLLEAYRSGKPVTKQVILSSTDTTTDPAQMVSLVQWGTMIVFDYLTGNYDRVASMQDAEEKEKDPKIIEESIRNLRKSASTGKLWLIDNECGLLDAYQLLEPYSPNQRFTTFHQQMLQTMCVFERPLVQALRNLFQQPSPHERLERFAISFEPLLKDLPKDNHYEKFATLFDKRLGEVMAWIEQCEHM